MDNSMANLQSPAKEVYGHIVSFPGCTTKEVAKALQKDGRHINQSSVLRIMYRLRDTSLVTLDMQYVEDEVSSTGRRKVARAFPAKQKEVPSVPPGPVTSSVISRFPQRIRLMAPPLEIPEKDTIEDAKEWLIELLTSTDDVRTFNNITMTPNRWRVALEYNINNRNVLQSRVNKYRKIIQGDRWIGNTDAIGFDTTPRLINGQHRAHASIQEDKAIIVDIKINMPIGSDLMLDGGLSRKNKDTIKTQLGIDNRNGLISATANWVEMYRKGLPGSFGGAENRLDQIDIVDYICDNPGIVEAAEMGSIIWSATGKKAIVKNIAGAAYFLTQKIDPVASTEFFLKLRTGANMQDNDPVLTLRNKMIKRAGLYPEAGVSGNNLCPQLAQVIYAWNYVRKSRLVSKLPDWKKHQGFPSFHS